MAETYRTGLAGLPTLDLTRTTDVLRHPAVRASAHPLVRPLRGAGDRVPGYVVTGPDGTELGVLVRVAAGRRPEFAVVPVEGRGPTARIEGRHAAAGALAMYAVQERVRAPLRAQRAEARAEAELNQQPMDPFDAEALDQYARDHAPRPEPRARRFMRAIARAVWRRPVAGRGNPANPDMPPVQQ